MKKLLATAIFTIASTSAFAGTAPTILSACVMPSGSVLSVNGMLSDPDGDAVSVAPLVVGVCVDGLLANYTYPASYNCNVPVGADFVTLVAGDAESNFSDPVLVDLRNAPSCEFF
ncbi:MAG: hypothetical protein K6L76_08395 [Agarilytica sp.]